MPYKNKQACNRWQRETRAKMRGKKKSKIRRPFIKDVDSEDPDMLSYTPRYKKAEYTG